MAKLMVGEIADCVKETYEVSPKNCPMFWGPPGIGKTQGVIEAAEELKKVYPNFFIATYILSQMESIDFAMPVVLTLENGEKTYKKLPISDFILPKDARGIIFFDELPNATPDVQKAAQSILTDRKIHEYPLPDGVQIVSAGNRKQDRAGSNGMLSALANRVEHYDCSASFDDWKSWALKKGVHHSVVGYLNTHTQNLNNFKPDDLRNPTPRVWERISNYMHHYDENPSKFTRRRIESMIGTSMATEFMQYIRCFEKFPTKQEIIKDPQKAKLPEEPDVQFSLMISIFNWMDKKTADAAFSYVFRMNKEFQMMFVTQAKKFKNEELMASEVAKKWCIANLKFLKDS